VTGVLFLDRNEHHRLMKWPQAFHADVWTQLTGSTVPRGVAALFVALGVGALGVGCL
jgi:hypothetical protein